MGFELVRTGHFDIGPSLTMNTLTADAKARAVQLCQNILQMCGVPDVPPVTPPLTMNAPATEPLVPAGYDNWPGIHPVWNAGMSPVREFGHGVTGYMMQSGEVVTPQYNYAGAAGALPGHIPAAGEPLLPPTIDWVAVQNARANPTRPVPVAGAPTAAPVAASAGADGVPAVAPLVPSGWM